MIRVFPEKVATWEGFGGAITEATAYNYSLLPKERQKAFLMAYYGRRGGLSYNFGRVAIGSNDFCLAPYEYTSSAKLDDFSIEHERRYVLPMLEDIFKMQPLRLIASPWSPPSVMKTNGSLIGGELKRRYFKRYAEYLALFAKEYEAAGFPLEFITPQNEPEAWQRWESCVFDLKTEQKFLKYLLPAMKAAKVKVLVWDHNKEKLFKVAQNLVPNNKNLGSEPGKVAGIAFHIYGGVNAEQMRLVREAYPEMLMVNTESCMAFRGDFIGAAERYLTDVMTDINCGVNAYLDWNMLLDSDGGPTDANNPVKAPIMLTPDRKDFILTPIYDYLKVVAEVFTPGTAILKTESDDDELLACASGRGVVLMNVSDKAKKYVIECQGRSVTGMITAHTILKR